MKRFLPFLAVLPLLSAPAIASPLRVCLVGCDAPRGVAGEVEINPVLYMSPAVSLTAAERDPFTRTWDLGVKLGFGYGLRWHPRGWRLKTPVLALDLYTRVSLSGGVAQIDLLPMLTVADLITAGVGLRCELAAQDRCGAVVAIGAGVSL